MSLGTNLNIYYTKTSPVYVLLLLYKQLYFGCCARARGSYYFLNDYNRRRLRRYFSFVST